MSPQECFKLARRRYPLMDWMMSDLAIYCNYDVMRATFWLPRNGKGWEAEINGPSLFTAEGSDFPAVLGPTMEALAKIGRELEEAATPEEK